MPEVEAAVRALRRHAEARVLQCIRLFHPSLRRRLPLAHLRSVVSARIERVERRGKHQLLHLDDGRVLHAHFRMNGDWEFGRTDDPLPRFARASLEFTDGTRIVLVDSRALGTLELHPAGVELDLGLGPDAADNAWTAQQFVVALAKRRGPIKPALLDQRLVAGLGNIYATESLWRARIDPRAQSNLLSAASVRALRKAIATVLSRATGSRYTGSHTIRLDVYDREGLPCRRCRRPVERITQAGRSTYWCSCCQQ